MAESLLTRKKFQKLKFGVIVIGLKYFMLMHLLINSCIRITSASGYTPSMSEDYILHVVGDLWDL